MTIDSRAAPVLSSPLNLIHTDGTANYILQRERGGSCFPTAHNQNLDDAMCVCVSVCLSSTVLLTRVFLVAKIVSLTSPW